MPPRERATCSFALPTERFDLRSLDVLLPHDIEPQEWDIVDTYIRSFIALREDWESEDAGSPAAL